MTEKKNLNREKWIDACRCVGVFLVYLAHFSTSAGNVYRWAFMFHVPLFFFLSGCAGYFEKDLSFEKYIKKKFRTILIPYFVFAVISLVVYSILIKADLSDVKRLLLLAAQGCIRNSEFPAGSLWFLTCLFVVELVFRLIRQFLHKKMLIPAALAIYLAQPLYYHGPQMPFNIDSVFYIFYFALGFVFCPYISELLEKQELKIKIFRMVLFIITGFYSAICFFGFDIETKLEDRNILIILFFSGIQTLVLICFIFLLGKRLCEFSFIQKTGQNSLYVFSSEFLVKTMTSEALNVIGLQIFLNTPLSTYIYSGFLLAIAMRLFVPVLRPLVIQIQLEADILCGSFSGTSD